MALTLTLPTEFAYDGNGFINATYWIIANYNDDRVSSGTITLLGYKDSSAIRGRPLTSETFTICGSTYSPGMTNAQLEQFIIMQPGWSGAVQS